MATPRASEKDFQAAVLQLAHLTGWLAYHTFDSRRSPPGYPDLTLVRGDRIIFAELKTDTGKATQDQETWLAALGAVPGIKAALWRPRDWSAIETTLKKQIDYREEPHGHDARGALPFPSRQQPQGGDTLEATQRAKQI